MFNKLFKIKDSCELFEDKVKIEFRMLLAYFDDGLNHLRFLFFLMIQWKLPFVGMIILVNPKHDLLILQYSNHRLPDLKVTILLFQLACDHRQFFH
jgi:hypothetical protein